MIQGMDAPATYLVYRRGMFFKKPETIVNTDNNKKATRQSGFKKTLK